MKNSHGFSLVQVLISGALLAGLATVSLMAMKDQLKLAENTSQRFDISYVFADIKKVMSDPVSCKATLEGYDLNTGPGSISSIEYSKVGSGEILYRMSIYKTWDPHKAKYGSHKNIKILSYKLEQPKNILDKTYLVDFVVVFEKAEGSYGGRWMEKRIPLKVKLGFNDKIDSCFANFSQYKKGALKPWVVKNSNIFLKGYNLGVGGVGTKVNLTVPGSVKIGSAENIFCNSDTAGYMKYSKVRGTIEFCNGTDWKEFGHSEINWNNPVSYSVGPEKQTLTTEDHRLCVLQSIQGGSAKNCKVKPNFQTSMYYDQFGKWSLVLSENNNEQQCRMACYN